jgi:hypothetical protein
VCYGCHWNRIKLGCANFGAASAPELLFRRSSQRLLHLFRQHNIKLGFREKNPAAASLGVNLSVLDGIVQESLGDPIFAKNGPNHLEGFLWAQKSGSLHRFTLALYWFRWH